MFFLFNAYPYIMLHIINIEISTKLIQLKLKSDKHMHDVIIWLAT